MRLLALPLLALACSADATRAPSSTPDGDTGGALGVRDLTVGVPPVGADQVQFASPEIPLDGFTELNLCAYGTYDGPTVGVVGLVGNSSAEVTHHTGVMAVYDEQFADGEVIDCLDQGQDGMGTYGPMFNPVGWGAPGGEPMPVDPNHGLEWLDMPEGLAFALEAGQRWTLDLHYINFDEQPALVNTVFTADVIPASEVEAWATTVMFDGGRINLQPGESELTFDCAFDGDYDLLSLMGHMHFFGTSFRADLLRTTGEVETIFEVAEWTPAHKEFPRIDPLELGELSVREGDVIRTTCAWNNETGEVQPDPAEMCSFEMVVTPLDRPQLCILGEYTDESFGEPPG